MNLIESSKAMIDLWLGSELNENDHYESMSLSQETRDWLEMYAFKNKKYGLNKIITDELKRFAEKGKTKVYRGIVWTEEGFSVWKKYFKEYPFETGESVRFNNSEVTGWTTDLDIAKRYIRPGYGQKDGKKAEYWVIFELDATPNEILCDTNLLPKKYQQHVYSHEKEVIILPKKLLKAKVHSVGKGKEALKVGWPEDIPK